MIDIINDNFNDLAIDYYKLQEEYEQLEQENKQLKSILTELEEWLKENKEICKHNANIISEGIDLKKRLNIRAIIYGDTLDKIQKLKEKYK